MGQPTAWAAIVYSIAAIALTIYGVTKRHTPAAVGAVAMAVLSAAFIVVSA